MADNVPITQGSGTNIATDDVAGVHFQKVKLDMGGDGVSVPLPAHDAAVAGTPLVIAGVSEDPADSAPSNVVDVEGDVTRISTDRYGVVYTHPHPQRIWHVATEYSTVQTDVTFKAAPGVGLSLYMQSIYVMATGVVDVTLEEGTTTMKFKAYCSGAGSGAMANFVCPIKLTANTALTITVSAAIAVTVVVTGFTAA